jgi:hypothetical protein
MSWFRRWLPVLVGLAYLAVMLATELASRGLPGTDADGLEGIFMMFGFGSFAVAGALILRHDPRHAIGWILMVVGAMIGVFVPLEQLVSLRLQDGAEAGPGTVFVLWVNGWYWVPVLALPSAWLPLLFPTGRLPSAGWRWSARVLAGLCVAIVLFGMLQPTLAAQSIDGIAVDNPIGIAGTPHPEGNIAGITFAYGVLVGLSAFVVRFRRSRGIERQQLKPVLLVLALLPLNVLTENLYVLGNILFIVLLIGIPTSIAVSVLRYRLYEVDRVISRTVAYLLVTGVLVGLYAGLVLTLGQTIGPLAGDQSDLVVAVSTLAVAAAFQPVRRRVQAVVDRRFDRRRYDAVRTIEAFGARLRDRVDLDQIAGDVREAVYATVVPVSAAVWVRAPEFGP